MKNLTYFRPDTVLANKLGQPTQSSFITKASLPQRLPFLSSRSCLRLIKLRVTLQYALQGQRCTPVVASVIASERVKMEDGREGEVKNGPEI